MELATLKECWMWLTILNGGILILSSILCVFARNWVYTVHSKFFPMSQETHTAILYSFVGFYKLIFITFNLTPYIALVLLSK